MSAQDAFEQLLAALHAASLDGTLWPATSALLDETCGLYGNALLFGSGPKDRVRVTSTGFYGFYARGERREALMREYLTHYHPIDERIPRFRRLPDSHVLNLAALYTSQELRTSPTYNEMLPRLRSQEGLGVRLVEPDGSHIAWITRDPVPRDGWSTPQLALIRGLLPHLRQFVRVRHALVDAGAQVSSLAALLDNTQLGVVHLDRWGRIVTANDRARALLRSGSGVFEQGGLLRARLPVDTARLEALVGQAVAPTGPASSGSLLPRPAGGRPIVVHVSPVPVSAAIGAVQVAAVVLLVEPGRPVWLDPAVVAQLLGLTPAESQVAVALAAGQSVRVIAAATGRQANSVRFLLKQIYKKLDLSGQADLVRVVLSLAGVPGARR